MSTNSIHYKINYKTSEKQNKTEKIFKDIFIFDKNIPANSPTPWQPLTDVYETPDEIIVKMSLSGTRPEDIRVIFSDETLTITGFRSDTPSHEKICFYQVEIPYGHFERSIYIPKPIDTDKIQATYKDGFLDVALPKAQQQQTKTFSVKINFH